VPFIEVILGQFQHVVLPISYHHFGKF